MFSTCLYSFVKTGVFPSYRFEDNVTGPTFSQRGADFESFPNPKKSGMGGRHHGNAKNFRCLLQIVQIC